MSCRSSAKAIFNFVPTPSMLLTRTGSRISEKFGANRPPKPPIFPSTSGPCVCLTSPWILPLRRLPKIHVHAGAGVSFFLPCHPERAKDLANVREVPRSARNDKLEIAALLDTAARVYQDGMPECAIPSRSAGLPRVSFG